MAHIFTFPDRAFQLDEIVPWTVCMVVPLDLLDVYRMGTYLAGDECKLVVPLILIDTRRISVTVIEQRRVSFPNVILLQILLPRGTYMCLRTKWAMYEAATFRVEWRSARRRESQSELEVKVQLLQFHPC
jgi:hypothetical protein